MPWKKSGVMEERARFVLEWQKGEQSKAELCRIYGVSRKTGYKILARYEAEGFEGLKDRSRAPLVHPNAVEEEVEGRSLSCDGHTCAGGQGN